MTDLVAPWNQYSPLSLNSEQYAQHHFDADIIVIGAGIAGASVAFEMAEQGFRVQVLEKEAEPATLGSGNVQGMLYLKLSPNLTYQNDLITAGFEKTLAILRLLTERGLLKKGDDWDDSGLLQLAQTPKQQENQARLAEIYDDSLLYAVNQAEASRLAGISLTSGGLFYPRSGWVSPPALVRALLNHPNITLVTESDVSAVKMLRSGEHDQAPLWQVDIKGNLPRIGKAVVLAMADQVSKLAPCKSIPFTVVRGQTTTVKGVSNLQVVVSGEGYVAPAKMMNGTACTTFGATFHRDQPGGNPTASEHLENVEMLALNSLEIIDALGLTQFATLDNQEKGQGAYLENALIVKALAALEGRAATRASAMGSLPIVGPIADRSLFLARFNAIRLDAKVIPDANVPWLRGLYLSTAHGSRGMITAPIAGEMIALYLTGGIEKYPGILRAAIHPNRFLYHELRFNKAL